MIIWDEVPKKNLYNKTEIIIYKCESEILNIIPNVRAELGLTQRDIAKKCGVSQATVARLESRSYSSFLFNLLRVIVPLGYILKVEKIEKD